MALTCTCFWRQRVKSLYNFPVPVNGSKELLYKKSWSFIMRHVSVRVCTCVCMCVITVYSTDLLVLLLKCELLLLHNLQLVSEVELSCLLLQLGEFVLVLGHLLQCRLLAARGKAHFNVTSTAVKVTGRRGRRRKQLRHEHYSQDATVFRIGYIKKHFLWDQYWRKNWIKYKSDGKTRENT